MKNLRFILFLLFIFQTLIAYSQTSEAFSILNEAQSGAQLLNPAYQIRQNKNQRWVTPFSSYSVDVHLPFSLNELFSEIATEESYVLDFDRMSLNAKHKNTFMFKTDFNWFSYSGSNENFNWNVTIQERMLGGLSFNKNTIDLINLGNDAYRGENLKLSFPIHELHFSSLNFTVAKHLNESVEFGVTTKLYFGKSLVNLNSDINLLTEQNGDYVDITVVGKGKISSPISLQNVLRNAMGNQSLMNYLFGFNNPGLGIDLGFNYSLNDAIELSASVNDLGFIYWTKKTTKFETNGSYKWEGVDISGKLDFKELSSFKESNTIETFRDSFLNRLIVPVNGNFLTLAPLTINAGMTYDYSKRIDLAALLQTQYLNHFIQGRISLMGAWSFHEKWKLISGLSFSNYSLFNWPTGLVFNGVGFKATVTAGNLWGFILPTRSRNFGGSFNFSYRLGEFIRVKKVYSKDYPFYTKRIIR